LVFFILAGAFFVLAGIFGTKMIDDYGNKQPPYVSVIVGVSTMIMGFIVLCLM
jgi:multisubunit Na+/H+ antiporter MnhG subunit